MFSRAIVLFCAVVRYVHTGIRITHFCQLSTWNTYKVHHSVVYMAKFLCLINFPLLGVTCIFKYEAMHSEAGLMISKSRSADSALPLEMQMLQKYKDVSLMSSRSDGHQESTWFVSVLKLLFFFWFCSCWMKFLLIVVEGESMYNYCSWIHSHSEMYCFIIVAGTCTFFWSMHFFMIQGMGF